MTRNILPTMAGFKVLDTSGVVKLEPNRWISRFFAYWFLYDFWKNRKFFMEKRELANYSICGG